jgi:hypothetical protein
MRQPKFVATNVFVLQHEEESKLPESTRRVSRNLIAIYYSRSHGEKILNDVFPNACVTVAGDLHMRGNQESRQFLITFTEQSRKT